MFDVRSTKFIKVVPFLVANLFLASLTAVLVPEPAAAAACSPTTGSVSIGGVTYQTATFTTTCTYTVPAGVTKVDAMLVGGGGGGAGGAVNFASGGGGGAGGFGIYSALAVAPGEVFDLVVGSGGIASGERSGLPGNAGGQTSLSLSSQVLSENGGSGGGAASSGTPGVAGAGGASGDSYNGGSAASILNGLVSGSGGSAISAGGSTTSLTVGHTSDFTGTSVTYANGGGGAYVDSPWAGLHLSGAGSSTYGSGGYGGKGSIGSYSYAYGGGNGVQGVIVLRWATPTLYSGQVDRGSTFINGAQIKAATDGTSTVTIVGTNLADVSSVTVNGQSASFSAISSTKLIFEAPAQAVGAYDLVLTNPSGSLTQANYVRYYARPVVTTDAVINGAAVASQSLTISASIWTNWNSKQSSWYRCETQVTTAQDGVPDDCSAIGWGGSTYELRSADICKFVTLREDLNNGGVYAPYRTLISTTRVLASASPWVLVTDGQNSTAETCSTTSSTVPVATSKSGVNFVEWNTAADGSGSAYQPGASLSLTGNLQLYAIYASPNSGTGNSSNPLNAYQGPTLKPLEKSELVPGSKVLFGGSNLDGVYQASIDGMRVEISHQSSSTIELVLPASLSAGLKDLVLLSDYGKLTVLDFLNVGKPSPSTNVPNPQTPKITIGSFNGYVVVYLKGHAGERLSLRIAGEWLVVDSLRSDFERVVKKRREGELVDVLVYINRALESETTQLVR